MALQFDIVDNRLTSLFDTTQELETLADKSDGLIFTEGPIWNRNDQHLTFSDIAGNTMYRWNETEGLQTLVPYSYKGNGNAYTPTGEIVTCEHATSRMAIRDGNGEEYKVLCSHYQGKELNSPNDVIVKSNGAIYFTDPHFGRNPSINGVPRRQQLPFQGVYLYANQELILLDSSFQDPNGLCFSIDEKRLFINDSTRSEICVCNVNSDGTISKPEPWAKTSGDGVGNPDGMKLDIEGNLYCCAQGGIHVFDRTGKFLGRIRFPGQVANLTFGGNDGKELYICAVSNLYRLRTLIGGY